LAIEQLDWDDPKLEALIAAERKAAKLAPHQFAACEVREDPCEYPEGSVGAREWAIAQAKWRQMKRDAAAGGSAS
jgi:hypothetical protein